MAKSQEELQTEWWKGWWAADCSWAGLAKKPVGQNGGTVHGGLHGEMDLQAYWRRSPISGLERDDATMQATGELLEGPDGRAWHIAHVPLRWADGTPAKEGWTSAELDRLAEAIHQRVAANAETRTDDWCNAEERDGRAQLSGIILPAAAWSMTEGRRLQAVLTGSLLPLLAGKNLVFGRGTRFDFTNFSGSAPFSHAIFDGPATFNRAFFSGSAPFSHAIFDGPATFNGAFFSGNADFSTASFSGNTEFRNATFSGNTYFRNAKFSRNTDFSKATFSRNADFLGVTFSGRAEFFSSIFSEDADFMGSTFSGNAEFFSATFSRSTDFRRTIFSENTNFSRAVFSEDANFRISTFSGNANFSNGEFKATASFSDCSFARSSPDGPETRVSFRGQRFGGSAEFDRASFRTSVRFTAASFARLASFSGIAWPDRVADWHGIFDKAVFKDLASFRGAGLRRFAAFDGAILQGGLQIDEADEATADTSFRAELLQAESMAEAETGLRQLEGGCRVLKQAMEKSANKAREQVFYAFELIARRRQRATPRWERLFSRLYELTADYGRSIGRPLIWLAALTPAFALAYMFLACGWRADQLQDQSSYRIFLETLSFSAQRVFPFGPWNLSPLQIEQSPVQKLLTGRTDSLLSLAIRTLGTIQSLLALTFAFLAGLAIRRRFQIN